MTEYQPIPFWSWNDQLDEERLKQQIRWMHESGIGGFFMHARSGLKTQYLSEDWMKCIETCCEEAEKQGMKAWAYDENGWPSGFVGGKLLAELNDRDMYIISKVGCYDASADVAYCIDTEELVRVRDNKRTGKQYLNLYIRRSASSVDILKPTVVDKFIANTHEKYKEHFGNEFSKKINGFFTDEPQYYRWETPYTPMVSLYFQETYNEDIFDSLGLLFVEKKDYRKFRYRYWCAMQKLMLHNFAKKVYDWCEENQIKITGHYIEETSMGNQLMCCGGVMPFYEYEHIPGIDWLGSDTENEIPPRQVSSVARQLGKRQILTETFGCCGWDVRPTDLRRIAGFQYANGVNMICHHLVPYSERGQRKCDYPAHYTPMNPWIKKHFADFNNYFSRLGYLLGTGEEPVNVALLHPMRSAYFDYKRKDEEDGFAIRELDEKLRESCRVFSRRGIAYHFLDETLLEKYGFVEGDRIGCGKCTYDYLVIPKILTMAKSTEKLVCQFVQSGGKVLLLDDVPQYLEGEPYQYTYLKSNCTLEDIVKAQPFEVDNVDTELYCAYRILNGKPLLFVQNASKTKSYTQTFRFADGSRSFTVMDPISFATDKLPLSIELAENEAVLLFPSGEQVMEEEYLTEEEFSFCNANVEIDANYLTVNVVRYSKDGEHYSEPMYRQSLFQKLLEERYQGKIWFRYDFEVQTVPEELILMAEEESVMSCNINGHKFSFTDTCEDEPSIHMADIAKFVHIGENYYETEVDWYQSETTYYALFGENVTESLRNSIVYDSEIEAVHLKGKFGVYSHAEYDAYDEQTVCGYDFYIGDIPEAVTELITDGFPFFSGKIRLRQNLMLDKQDISMKLTGRYLTANVYLNNNHVGELFFDRRIDLSQYTKLGENILEVEFTIGNRNLMGPFHYADEEKFVWPGSFEQCDLPKSEDGQLRYKLYRFYTEKETN